MKMVLKWILGLVATLAILLVVITIALPLLLDPNDYKDEISEAVEQRTGRELAIDGDISWRVFPSVGLQISDMSLANRAGFGAQPMLEIAEAAVTVKLQPLFNRQLEVGRVDLKGVMAYLRSNTDGRNNWEDLARRGAATATVQELPADLEIQISSADISLENTARRVNLDGFDRGDSTITASQAFDLAGRFKVEFLHQQVAGDVNFVSLVQAVRGQGLIGLQDLEFTFSGTKGPAEDTLPLELQSSTDMVVDLGRDQAELTNLVLQFFNLRAKGVVNVTSLSGEPEYSGRAVVAEFNPRQLIEELGLKIPKTSKPDALSRLSAEMNFNGSSDGVDVPEMAIVLDDSTLEGQFNIAAFAPLQLAFDMNIDALNLDDYSLLVEAEGTADEDVEIEGAGLLVGSMLLFNGGGDLGIGRLVTGGLTAENVNVTVTSNTRELRLFPISSSFYGGQHQGDVRLDFSDPQPVLTANQVISGFDTSTLLNDLTGNARLHGTGDAYLKVRTVLGSSQQTRQALSGDVGLSIMNGVIDDVDIPGAVAKVTALLGQQGGANTVMQATQNMEFAELIVTGIISRGIVKSDDLLLSSALVNATGAGVVNLVNETVDYTIHPVLVGKLAAQMPADYRDISIPVRITGQMWEPNVSLDIAAGITASQKAKMANKAGEVADALLQGLSSKKKDKQ